MTIQFVIRMILSFGAGWILFTKRRLILLFFTVLVPMLVGVVDVFVDGDLTEFRNLVWAATNFILVVVAVKIPSNRRK